MIRRSLALTALASAALLALTACASPGGEPAEPGDPAEGANGGVNTEAPLYDMLPDKVKDAGKIVMAGDNHPPYRSLEEDGSITGIDPDLQAVLSEQFGVPFEIETVSGMEAILTGMNSGRYDAFNGPLRTTPEREADFDAIVWMTTISSYVYLADRADELGDHEALCGARVAGVAGSVTESQVERYSAWCEAEGLETPEFIGLEDTNSTFLAVQSDRADYAGTTQTAALDLQKSDPGKFEFLVQTEAQGAGIDQLALMTPKGNGLAEPLFAAFEAIFDNGQYEEVMSEWDLTEVSVDAPLLNPLTGN